MAIFFCYCLLLLFNPSLSWKLIGKKVVGDTGSRAFINATLIPLDNSRKVQIQFFLDTGCTSAVVLPLYICEKNYLNL